MPSLRLLTFLAVSVMGHAAILVPLSNYVLALFDSEEIHSETIVVSISVISQPEATVEENNETREPTHPLHQVAESNDADQPRIDQRNTLVETLPGEAAPNTPEQTLQAAADPLPVRQVPVLIP